MTESIIEINKRLAEEKRLADNLCSDIPEFGSRFTLWTKLVGELWHYDQATYSNPVTWNNDVRWCIKLKALKAGWSFFPEGVNPNDSDIQPYVFPIEYLEVYGIVPQNIDDLRKQYSETELKQMRLKNAQDVLSKVSKPKSAKEQWLDKISASDQNVRDIPRLILSALLRSGDVVQDGDIVKLVRKDT